MDDLTGESVNDAKYERTQAVREKLNVEINHTNTTLEKVAKDVPAAVAAGDDISGSITDHRSNGNRISDAWVPDGSE